MNKIKEQFKRVGLAAVCLMAFCMAASASGTFGTIPFNGQVVNSALSTSTSQTLATNGQYPSSIVGPQTIVTNVVALNPGNPAGNSIALQFTATAGGTVSASTVTNVLFNIVQAVQAPALTTTNSNGAVTFTTAGTTQPFATVTLNLNTTAGSVSTTNLTYYSGSTTPFTGGLKLYLSTITADTTSAAWVTNYSVNMIQTQ